jgi:hypothetical protein
VAIALAGSATHAQLTGTRVHDANHLMAKGFICSMGEAPMVVCAMRRFLSDEPSPVKHGYSLIVEIGPTMCVAPPVAVYPTVRVEGSTVPVVLFKRPDILNIHSLRCEPVPDQGDDAFYSSPHSALTSLFQDVPDWDVGRSYTLDLPAFLDAFQQAGELTTKTTSSGSKITTHLPSFTCLLTAHGVEAAAAARMPCQSTVIITELNGGLRREGYPVRTGIERLVESLRSRDSALCVAIPAFQQYRARMLVDKIQPRVVSIDLNAVTQQKSLTSGEFMNQVVMLAAQASLILSTNGILIVVAPTYPPGLIVDVQQITKPRDMITPFHRHFNVYRSRRYFRKRATSTHFRFAKLVDDVLEYTVYLFRPKIV